MKIKAIFFDMDGTLVNIPMPQEQLLSIMYQKLGLHFTIEQIKTANKKMEKCGIIAFRGGFRDRLSMYRSSSRFLLASLDLVSSRSSENHLESHPPSHVCCVAGAL